MTGFGDSVAVSSTASVQIPVIISHFGAVLSSHLYSDFVDAVLNGLTFGFYTGVEQDVGPGSHSNNFNR